MLIPFDGLAEPPVKAVNQADAATAGSLRSDWSPPDFKSRRDERDQMVSMIRSYGLKDEDVLHAMASVPRHEFVPEKQKQRAYRDSPLPIGHGQTISQPFIVAEMTRLLHVTPTSKVLEIGTGSGYQAAVLTEFTPHVFSVEIIEPLFKAARERLQRLGYETVQLRHGDGYYGWPEKAPFDGIVVTAASGEIPPPLLKQLKPGGRMIIPVGPVFGVQSLMLVQKDQSGAVRTRSLMSVRFVPFTRTENTRR
ncbi:MAG: protein-L-isoaspartate(D-aspartate) O-methyltransferase [Deltaproteobacteria bacterium]|nr:protein-L-isoaspartate(D-aspartate) O-methyltransferase [Deltaproteobacteria bacterium]